MNDPFEFLEEIARQWSEDATDRTHAKKAVLTKAKTEENERIRRRRRRLRRRNAKKEQIALELATLADELFRDNRCLSERMTELVEFCRQQCRHRLWQDVAAIEFHHSIDLLAAWEKKLPRKSLRVILSRSDVLSFDVINGLKGYTLEFWAYRAGDRMIQSTGWAQPSISVL